VMERIGDEVGRTLGRANGGASALPRVLSAWPAAVGETVARNAWPLRQGRDGTLHVATASATWAFELDRLAPELASRLRELLGEEAPTRFRFRPGPIPEAPRRSDGTVTEGSKECAEVTPEVAAAAESAAAEIDDPELRELVARAARASLASGGSGRSF
jgi:hypothetical protein